MQPASAAGVLMRIDGDTAAANCVCKESMPKPHLRPANGGQADFALRLENPRVQQTETMTPTKRQHDYRKRRGVKKRRDTGTHADLAIDTNFLGCQTCQKQASAQQNMGQLRR